jgi:hypothetical protein
MLTGAAALGVASIFLAAPSSLTVTPAEAAPGGTVTVRAACDKALQSDVLDRVTLKGKRGTTKVKKTAKPGTYTVSIKCGEATAKATFTVLGDPTDVVTTAVNLPSSSPGAGTFVLGGVALLTTVGAGFFALRRLRRET